ncbi:MAG: NADH-quinone oxidoreductase subunit L [Candidatus Eisenbacteria bacterium]
MHGAFGATLIPEYDLLKWIVLLPLIGAAWNGFFGKKIQEKLGEKAIAFVAVGTVAASFVMALVSVLSLRGVEGGVVTDRVYTWFSVGDMRISVNFLLDHLSAVMILVVTGVGGLIHLYSVGYMHGDRGYYRYFAFLNLFTFAMLTLVTGDNLLLLFVGWEGVGLCSYLLIGFWFTDMDKAIAGMKAFITNRIGDLGFIVGVFALWWYFAGHGVHSVNFYAMAQSVHLLQGDTIFGVGLLTFVGIALFVGAAGKSAQIPLYVWLPDAMAGPTPVSALIHAATMVTAGVYMIARMNFLYTLAPAALGVVAVVGAATALFAATIGIAQTDIKKVLAYSTVSQLGYMVLGVGVGAYAAGIFHLMTHAFFKACLFLCSGSVIHAMGGEQDMRKMGGLRKHMPVTFATMFIATLAISGIPGLSGFFSKDEILWKAFSSDRGNIGLWIVGFLAAGITAFYMFRLIFMTFFGECRADEKTKHHLHESPKTMTIPLVILAALSIGGGWVGIPEALKGGNQFHHYLAPVVDPGNAHGKTLLDWDLSEELGARAHATTGEGKVAAEAHGEAPVHDAHGAAVSSHGAPSAHGGHSAATEYLLMILSVAVALGGIGLAHHFYMRRPELPERIRGGIRGLHRTVENKYFVDEIYGATVIGGLMKLSRFLGGFDNVVIDGFVNLTGWAARLVSRISGWFDNLFVDGLVNLMADATTELGDRVRRVQTGTIQSYVMAAFGGIIILIFLAWRF